VTTNVRVIQARDFLHATPEGAADLKAAERLLAELARHSEGLEDFDVLVDTRRVNGTLSAAQLWFLSEQLARYHGNFARKTAILCPVERFDHAQFFALCAENRGFNIMAFDSYEDAMEWLLESSSLH
jgi:hypothetical protein